MSAGVRHALRSCGLMLAVLIAPPAHADVSVSVIGNQAFAQIALPASSGIIDADVTITFDSPANLSPASLNLTAQVIHPHDPVLRARLPACVPLDCVAIDPAFPLLITVEPPAVPWLFHSGFEADGESSGLLAFLNTYEIEIHTPDLDCAASAAGEHCPATQYRLFKAPVDGPFADYTQDVLKGSVRARGRGGSFSQFLIVADQRVALSVELEKSVLLQARIIAAMLDGVLSGELLGLLADVQVAVTLNDFGTAIARVDALIQTVAANAGTGIANYWSADRGSVNDAGDIEALAWSLRYTLVRLQDGT